MGFKSVDEIFNFDFQDAQIFNFKINDEMISFDLEALIVEPENSQNENYTKSYAGTTKVRLMDGKVVSGLKDGFKRYDANDKLIEEVPDTYIENSSLVTILKNLKGAFLFAMDANSDSEEGKYSYNVSIEIPSKEAYDAIGAVSYQINMTFSKAIFEWDRYMNKVQS